MKINTVKVGSIGLLLIVLGLGAIAFIGCQNGIGEYSTGSRAGTVYKLSRKGMLLKSYEGELLMNSFGLRSSNAPPTATASSGNVWHFSIQDPQVAAKVQAALDSGKPCVLKYTQKLIKPYATDTDYIVTDVVYPETPLEPAPAEPAPK